MIFFCDANGTIQSNFGTPVYQGAANSNVLYLIAPYAPASSVMVGFQLPNGTSVALDVMTPQNAIPGIQNAAGASYAGWSYVLPASVTALYGTVSAQFYFYAPPGESATPTSIIATAQTSFQIGKGVPITLPQTPDSTAYSNILNNLSIIQNNLNSGYYVASGITAWNNSTTYSANEITYYPNIGEYGAFVVSLISNNTNNAPYVNGEINSNFWKEICLFDALINAANNITAAQEAAQNAAQSAQSAAQSASAAQSSATSAAQSAQQAQSSDAAAAQSAVQAEQSKTLATQAQAGVQSALQAAQSAQSGAESAQSSAQQYAQDAQNAAADLDSYKSRILKTVDALPQTGDPQYIYAIVDTSGTHTFLLYTWENNQWVSLGGANITTNYTSTYNKTLYAASWQNKMQTITIDGLSNSDYVSIIPTDANSAAFINAGITVTQNNNVLTFTCETQPGANINIIIEVTTLINTPEAGQGDYYTQAQSDELFGATLSLTINSSTYIITAILKSKDGTILSTQTIDLPIESMVVNASYDNSTQAIILTLQNGETVTVPVGDLVNGLATETALNAEISARQQADTTLQQNINNETTARQQADSALQTSITNIVNGTTQVTNAANADAATRAQQDGNGANIAQTYATKAYVDQQIGSVDQTIPDLGVMTIYNPITLSVTISENTQMVQATINGNTIIFRKVTNVSSPTTYVFQGNSPSQTISQETIMDVEWLQYFIAVAPSENLASLIPLRYDGFVPHVYDGFTGRILVAGESGTYSWVASPLPNVSASNNGMILGVSNGAYALVNQYIIGTGLTLIGDTVSVNVAAAVESGNSLPVSSDAVYQVVGNIDTILESI